MAIFLRGAIFYEYFRNLIIPFRNKNGLIVVKLIKKRVIYMRNIRKHELSRLSNLYIRGLLNPSLGNYFQLNCRLRRERTKSVRSNFFFFFVHPELEFPRWKEVWLSGNWNHQGRSGWNAVTLLSTAILSSSQINVAAIKSATYMELIDFQA